MNRSVKALQRWFALASVALYFGQANATTVIPPSFEQLTDRAELIFVGKVRSARAEWRTVGPNRVIFTLVEFEREELLKGEAGSTLSLQFLGGTVGDVTLEVAEMPKFNPGDRELLFVTGNGVRFCPLVGAFHGKLGIRTDPKSGRNILVRHNGQELRNVAEIGKGPGAEFAAKRPKVSVSAAAEPLSLEEFKAKIQERLGNGTRQK